VLEPCLTREQPPSGLPSVALGNIRSYGIEVIADGRELRLGARSAQALRRIRDWRDGPCSSSPFRWLSVFAAHEFETAGGGGVNGVQAAKRSASRTRV